MGGLLGAKPSGFPIEQNHRFAHASSTLLEDVTPYRRLVGRLIYLVITRHDLAYAVHILSQFLQAPRQEHWDATLRVVCYLKGTLGQGILLLADSDLSLQGCVILIGRPVLSLVDLSQVRLCSWVLLLFIGRQRNNIQSLADVMFYADVMF